MQTLHDIDIEDSGRYTCLASNVAGAAEKIFILHVLGKYTFSSEPVTVLKAPGLHRGFTRLLWYLFSMLNDTPLHTGRVENGNAGILYLELNFF